MPCQPCQCTFPSAQRQFLARGATQQWTPAFGTCVLGVRALLELETISLMVKQVLAGGTSCTCVASQRRCLMGSWLLLLTFSSRSLSPLLGQCPGMPAVFSVAVETLLGGRSGSALQAPLSTSLDSSSAFPLLSSPPTPQGILASELPVGIPGLLLPGVFECCLCYAFL